MNPTQAMPTVVRPKMGWQQLRKRTRVVLIGTLLLGTLFVLELGARFFWAAKKQVPFFGTSQIWKTFYPEWNLSNIEASPTTRDDEFFDVLILGASTVADPAVRLSLKAELEKAVTRPVRVWGLACPGRLSLDNVRLYERLQDRRFDLVLYYQGINDVFMNNTPPGSFRDDYSHSYHLKRYESFQKQASIPYFTLPFTIEYLVGMQADLWVITDRPRGNWGHYASDLRIPPVFEANLERLVAIAAQRADKFMIMSFAYYIPENYTDEAFEAKQLDYDAHTTAIKTWGKAEPIRKGIDAHNDAIFRVRDRHPELMFLDQRALIPDGKKYWNDCCHFTDLGSLLWAQNVAKIVGKGW
ncbi:MAG: hypothetical protein K8T89_23490 [Planctomycetes bacterium]|nr:hypothetical protein [Planctomycetota bacterium]